MSLLPLVHASDPFYSTDIYRPRRFRFGFNPWREIERIDNMMNSMMNDFQRDLPLQAPEIGSQIQYDDKGNVSLRCQTTGFRPEELTVDIQGDRLLVSGQHMEGREGERLERHFSRLIRLPKEVNPEQIKCQLEENGELSISAPLREQLEAPRQRVPIEAKRGQAV